jgi:hypothetical protein
MFPVSEFPAFQETESSLQQTASSATQSAIFAISPEDSKSVRISAHLLRPEAPEKHGFSLQQPIPSRFSLPETEPVPFRTSRRRISRDNAFHRGNRQHQIGVRAATGSVTQCSYRALRPEQALRLSATGGSPDNRKAERGSRSWYFLLD